MTGGYKIIDFIDTPLTSNTPISLDYSTILEIFLSKKPILFEGVAIDGRDYTPHFVTFAPSTDPSYYEAGCYMGGTSIIYKLNPITQELTAKIQAN